ncbi:hexitol phosphatase HxpB [Pseudoalteromonas fenneropenaei]
MQLSAAIFDMDGVLINSEPFWQQAEYNVFSKLGVTVSPQLAAHTATMTTSEVSQFWYAQQPWSGTTLEQAEQAVIAQVVALVATHGKALNGVEATLKLLTAQKVKIGLATNAPAVVMNAVLDSLQIRHFFHAVTSADEVTKGKPAPDVYHFTLQKLQADSRTTIAFEDSITGLRAAKAAALTAIAVPPADVDTHRYREVADYTLDSLQQFNLALANALLRA